MRLSRGDSIFRTAVELVRRPGLRTRHPRGGHVPLAVVARVADQLILGDDYETMLQSAFDIVAEQLGDVMFSNHVLEQDANGEFLLLAASRGLDEMQKALIRRPEIQHSLSGVVLRRRDAVVIRDLGGDTSRSTEVARSFGLKAFAGFPLMAGERVLGTVTFGSRSAPSFEPDELTLMHAVTLQVAAAMERLRLERAARTSEARLRLALEVSGMGAWSWDWQKDILDPDTQFLRLHGLDPAEHPTASSSTLMAQVHVDDRQTLEDALRACGRGQETLQCEYRVVLPGGVIRWLAIHGSPVTTAGSSASCLVGLTQDITVMVAAREGYEREAAEFERLAEHRAVALVASEERLAQASKMEALGRLAGGIAHDFNNVLQAVEGSTSMALHSVDTDRETTKRYLRLAADACARGASVTERLLAFGRRSPLRAVALEAISLLEGLADMLRPTLGPRITLAVECSLGLPLLLADRHRLEAVLVNLANNARDAMPDGGRLVLAADLAPEPDDRSSRRERCLRLRVIDQGEGMTPDVLRRVSEPFFTTKPMGKGTGLGLAMARSFAEQSGGAFAIQSAPGRGTTVTLLLPVAVSAAAPSLGMAEAAARWPVLDAAAAILLIEDEPNQRTILAAQLSLSNYDVTAVEGADVALDLIDGGYRPEALVADLTLAGERDGLELLAQARIRLPRLPGLIITGHLTDGAAERLADTEKDGPFAVLRKPASGEVLRERVARVLAQAGRWTSDVHAR